MRLRPHAKNAKSAKSAKKTCFCVLCVRWLSDFAMALPRLAASAFLGHNERIVPTLVFDT
jgi:hypothetical protein